jgi:hypothetical protein
MSKRLVFAVLIFLAGSVGIGHASPPKPASLKEALENLNGKCGTLAEKGGLYEFLFDSVDPREGKDCLTSVGTDAVMFEPNHTSQNLGGPQTYLIIPIGRIVLRLRQ